MIKSFPADTRGGAIDKATWIDLIEPTEDEIATVQSHFNMQLPTKSALEEIEVSSRLRARGDTLVLTAPLISGTKTDHWSVAPVGFVLTPSVLVTIRFAQLESFDAVADALGSDNDNGPAATFTRLLEEVVDRAADHLERASEAINATSQAIFFDQPKRQRLSRDTAMLRDAMRKIGRVSDRVARVRYAFLSIGRIADFALERCSPKLDGEVRERLEAVRRDISSLDEFETSLSGRIQLLQDSAVGFISIEQNEVVKVLTVASVVGVPPVLVVGIYGMNFKNMPELSWRLGYPYALILCVLSGLLPLLWFKWRDWI